MDALYLIQLPNAEYIGLVEDVLRMVVIQSTIQFLYFVNSNGAIAFFSADFFLLLLYIVLGVCVYWLVFKKLIVFK